MAHMSKQLLKTNNHKLAENYKQRKVDIMANTIMATINGVMIPVEVSDEELMKALEGCDTSAVAEARQDGHNEGYLEGMNDGSKEVKSWIIEEMIDYLDDDGVVLHDSDEYFDFVNHIIEDNDAQTFADCVVNGTLKKTIEEWLKEQNKERYYEFDVELYKTVYKKATVTVTVKAPTEDDARDYIACDVDRDDLADLVDDDDWELDDEEITVEDYYLNRELTNKYDGENLINEDD